jgi:hypothetical protein
VILVVAVPAAVGSGGAKEPRATGSNSQGG